MTNNEEIRSGVDLVLKEYGSRVQFLFYQLQQVAMSGQVCDITTYSGPPNIDVKVEADFFYALMYGAGAEKLAEMLSMIRLSNGQNVSIKEIWTINPMPRNGFTEEELASVDLAEGEQKMGPNGETLREMISATYHCASASEENKFLRRFIAS